LLQDGELTERITNQAREECRKYNWDAVRGQWLELYEKLAVGIPAIEEQKAVSKRQKAEGGVVDAVAPK
ncbi:MAG: hypothetical protein M3Y84_03665, partial [Acidobacteriota bacterium]|nr:hypothetical protein [Acidobacteriota bacterium]